ncbi:uncharacterized protein LOC136711778 [Amia ocellicauda]|uniref:uncharacterized protein LOC136711778 n=1 Tax=Amia ocellicauda TaxID=2972642 RepID=UPI0034642EF9
MNQLYSCLQTEIASFESHVQQCKDVFDLDTLQNVLLELTQDYQGEIQSLDMLRQLAEAPHITDHVTVNISINNESSDFHDYISWLFSFMDHLCSMKETFDDKVVIPLCENLYVNEEEETIDGSSDLSSSLSWTKPVTNEQRVSSHDSITEVANELFILRRRWALLLTSGLIRSENFSPQSAPKAAREALPFARVLWLVPDIFYKSLLAAKLASRWVDLHQRRYSHRQWPIHSFSEAAVRTSSKNLDSEETEHLNIPPGLLRIESRESQGERVGEIREKLRDGRMELMALGWRDERAKALKQRVLEVSSRVQNLQMLLEEKRKEMDRLKDQVAGEARDMNEAEELNQMLEESQNLERHLKLEEYHQKILQGDLMLELEIRPAIIRQINMIQDQSKDHEEMLKVIEDSMNRQETLHDLSMLTPDTLSIISNSSSLFSLK